MALDTSIPLAVQQPKLVGPADMISLQGLVRQNQLGQLQIEDAVRARQEQDALRTTLRDPGAIDPKTGLVSLEGLQKVYAASPEAGVKMAKERQASLKTIAELGKIDAETLQARVTTAGKQADLANQVYQAASIAYDQAKARGVPEEQAIQAGKNALIGKIDEFERGGLAALAGFTPEAIQKARGEAPDPGTWKSRSQTYTQFLTDLRAQQELGVKKDTLTETGRHNRATEGQQAATLVETKRHNTETEKSAGQHYDAERGVIVDKAGVATPVRDASGTPVPAKITEAQKKELSSIEAQRNTIKGALDAVSKTPSAFGMTRGLATMAGSIPESVAGRMDSKDEREARSFVFNVVSKVINERAGAAQSKQELARLRSFLPAETDGSEQIKDKLEAFDKYLGEQKTAYEKPQPSGGGDLKSQVEKAGGSYEPDKYEYRVVDGKVQRRKKG